MQNIARSSSLQYSLLYQQQLKMQFKSIFKTF